MINSAMEILKCTSTKHFMAFVLHYDIIYIFLHKIMMLWDRQQLQ